MARPAIVIDERLPVRDREKLFNLIRCGLPATGTHEVKLSWINEGLSNYDKNRLHHVVDRLAEQRGNGFYQLAEKCDMVPCVAEISVSQILQKKETPIHWDVQGLAEKICMETGWALRGKPIRFKRSFAVKLTAKIDRCALQLENLILKCDKMLRLNFFKSSISAADDILLSRSDLEKIFNWFLVSGRVFKIHVETHTEFKPSLDRIAKDDAQCDKAKEISKALATIYKVNFIQILRFGQEAEKYNLEVFATALLENLRLKDQRYFLVGENEKITSILKEFSKTLLWAVLLLALLLPPLLFGR